jgi:hypothetical protein
MPKYILVNADGIQEVEAEEMLNLKEIQNLVGVPGEEAFFEPVYQCYSDRSIVILCDDDSLRKHHQPTCVTSTGVVLHGQIIIVRIEPQIEDYNFLTPQQVEIVRETKLYRSLSH